MARVLFNHVTKRFGDVTAVNDLNLEVSDTEFLVLVGPSGCGKTTALRTLAGLEEVSEGEMYIGERLVNNVPASDRDIAMVFQSYALYPHMSVYDNLAFSLKLRKIPRSEIPLRVKKAAEMLGIQDLLGRKPRALSGGQRQRVALGRAIVREPAVFLLDEPLSNLDAKLRVQTRAEISKLHKRLQTTFIYVTHDQVEAMTMATRVAVLNEGVLQQVGSPQELYASPDNMFVAGFIGSPAMNFFDVKVTGNGEGLVVDAGSFQARVPKTAHHRLAPYLGKRVTLGIRPENIYDRALVPTGIETSPLRATVDVSELMGNEVFLYMRDRDHEFLARVDPRSSARPGQEVELAMDMSKMHAFDPKTQQALLV